MKKKTLLLAALALSLLLAACGTAGAEGGETSFSAVILEQNGSSVLVQPVEGDDILRSADRISFSCENLDDIGAETGDTVTVTYTGGVMETYPAQVKAVHWSLLNKGEPEEMPEPPSGESTTAEFSLEDMSMRVTLPEGWRYEIDDSGTNGRYSINFHPDADPELTLMLEYHSEGIGICGTGVTFTDMAFAGGLTATAATEQMETDYWFFLMYEEPYRNYVTSCTAPTALWTEYEPEIMAILDTVELGGQL